MRIRIILLPLVLALVLVGLTGCGPGATSDGASGDWSMAFVIWEGDTYKRVGANGETVGEVGEKLGEVTTFSDDEAKQVKRGEVFSNFLPEGTGLYAIDGVDEKEAIAAKIGTEGQYLKLVSSGSYPY
ncbi:hypothetical protein [Paenibacillus xanthanilyticus]|uniref:DUF3221 domain-containing protein n=1 Tax=Paenibacillus xanthanilyticus TaxID=1783531 RepID=A0ABV8JUH4_9BACL